MAQTDTFQTIARECRLSPDAAWQLTNHGFVVIPGPGVQGGIAQAQAAYDTAVASADIADVRISSSTRVTDFVNRAAEFDALYIYPPLLAACRLVIGRPFKLSNTCARTLEPGATAQKLHVDLQHGADGWPLVGYIWMIDAFSAENGATRFVSGSHLRRHGPEDCNGEAEVDSDETTLACGPAGSLIVFNASVWHGYTANQSAHRRRSVQGHFVPRDAKAAIDYRSRMRPETASRIRDVARYLLDLPETSNKSLERTHEG
jgi:ectoine hydroxylase-related dioxygenase (phytanoyl-CoA dioxygenase family)